MSLHRRNGDIALNFERPYTYSYFFSISKRSSLARSVCVCGMLSEQLTSLLYETDDNTFRSGLSAALLTQMTIIQIKSIVLFPTNQSPLFYLESPMP